MSRSPDFLETFFICRSTAKHYSNGFRMTVRLNKKVDSALLSNSLRGVLVKYPILAINYFRHGNSENDKKANGSNFSARLVFPILYDDVVSFEKVQAVDNVYYANFLRLDIPVNVEKPTWVVIVSEADNLQYVTFATNHVALDGNSGVHFMDDLVAGLNEAELQSLPFVKVLFDESDVPDEVPLSSDNVVSFFHCSKWYLFKSIMLLLIGDKARTFFLSYFVPGYPNLFKHPIFNYSPITKDYRSVYHVVNLPPDKMGSTLQFCKGNGLTLTPFMASCAFKAMDDTFAPKLNIQPSYSFNLDVCGRRYYPEIKDKTRYGLYMSAVNLIISREHSLLLAARAISKTLTKSLKDRLAFMYIGLLRLVNPWKFIQEQYDKKKTRTTIEVSNVGLVKIVHGDWRVQDIKFSQGCGTNHVNLSTASTSDGGLNVVIATLHSLDDIEDGIVDQFVDSFQRKLLLED